MRTAQLDLSRRHFLAGVGLGGVALAAGCSSAVNAQSAADVTTSGTNSGGTLRGGIGNDLVPANFYTNSNSGITTVVGLVFEGLIRYPNTHVVPTPRLATSWKLAPNGRSLALELRKGVTFHTGRAFTSKDVEFSLSTYAQPIHSGQMQSTAAAITHYDTSNPHRVVLHFTHPLDNIFDLLDTVPIVDKETFAGIGTGKQYVGTGPFKFVSWQPGSRLTFTKNDDYWQPGKPHLDGVVISIVPDATSLTSQLRSGQIDYSYGNSYLDIKQLAASGKFTKTQMVGAEEQIYIGTTLQNAALSDGRIRQAIAYALDRDRIVSEVFQGSGYSINLPWPKYSTAYDAKKNTTYALNVAKAKALVKDYGKTLPKIPLAYQAQIPFYEATAQIAQANLEAVGIPVTLVPTDPATFVKQLIGASFEGLWTTFHSWAQYTPSTLTVSAYPFNAAHNASHFSSTTYTSDALGAWEQTTGTDRIATKNYESLSDDLLKALFLIEIGVVQPQFVTSTRLQGVSYTKRTELDLRDATLA